jgi:hypothetical protein
MKPLNSSLIRKLTAVLLLKLAVLMALWWCFVREERVTVDSDSVAAQFLQRTPLSAKEGPP